MSNDLSKVAELTKHQAFGLKTIDSDGKVTKILPDKDDMLIDVSKFKREPNTDDSGGEIIDPEHPSVGDDVYAGDVNKGEVIKRFKLWEGPSGQNKDTTVIFSQDLGKNLDSLGDGLQAQLSMIETPYLAGKALKPRTVKVGSKINDNWNYNTDVPVPISFKKERVASKDKLSVPVSVKNSKIIYSSAALDIPEFTTGIEYPTKVPVVNISNTDHLNSVTPNIISYDGFKVVLEARSGARIIVTKNGARVGVGLIAQSVAIVDQLEPETLFKLGDFKVHYEDIYGNVVSNELDVESFSTIKKGQEPKDIYSYVYPNNSVEASVTQNGFAVVFLDDSDNAKGRKLGILDDENRLVAESDIHYSYVFVDGLKPNTKYSGYKFIVFSEHDISNTDVVISPKISFQYSDDGNMIVSPTQGIIKDNSGAILTTYDVIVNYINSYTSQTEVSQINPQNILFSGVSNNVQLRDVSKNFDNVSDGLLIYLYDYVQQGSGSEIRRYKLDDIGFPTLLKIPREYIFSGISTVDLSGKFSKFINSTITSSFEKFENGIWKSYTSNTENRKVASCDVKAILQNGSIDFIGDIHTTTSGVTGETIWNLHIASVTTYKEDE